MTAKDALRRRMKQTRQSIAPEVALAAETQCIEHVLAALPPQSTVMAYVSIRAELPTRRLLGALRAAGHDVAVPRIVGRRLEPRLWTGTLVPGSFRVPTSDGPLVTPMVVLVPGLAFDRRGYRVGYGGGFYDRFLDAHPHAQTLGMAYELQRVDRVPTEPHDRPVAGLITEAGSFPSPEETGAWHDLPR
jgi:5-formyltetrahydrofolate cyclo-ligase